METATPTPAAGQPAPAAAGHPSPLAPLLIVWLLITGYTVFFSAYTLQRHATLNTFAADLSFIDQPMWNTLHGRFLERTLDTRQAPRVAEHFEPLLLPLSLVYLIWDDVRAILILQTIALAIGALPVYWIARSVFGRDEDHGDARASWLGVVFAAVYLLFPALQAANVADFHADPFVVAPLLFAFWYALRRRWVVMWAWAVVVMAAKENMATLTAMLGLLLIFTGLRERRRGWPRGAEPGAGRRWGPLGQGLALVVFSVAWFAAATFLVVAPLARQIYGTEGPVYLANRYVEFGATPREWLQTAWRSLQDPARGSYLTGLFASAGGLALLAPEYLLLGLPLLVANMFSNFPGQFSGEQHYSAPLASSFVLAAIYGGERLMRLVERLIRARWIAERGRSTLVASVIGAWALAFALGQQVDRGWTPLARYFTWPERTGHHLLLERFLTQIPPEAAVSASPAVHPHLAHRHKIYVYPVIEDAEFILVDVTGVTDMHPLDLKERLDGAVAQEGFGILDAADGYVLLQRGAGGRTWPEEFVSFARVSEPHPAHPASATFGDGLELIGYDVIDEPRWRLTRLRFYLRVRSPLSPGTVIRYEARTPAGGVVDSSELRPPPALLWYQAERWRPGETIALETIPWFLPRTFAPALAVTVDGTPVPPRAHREPGAGRSAEVRGEALLLPAWTRARGILTPTDGVPGTVTAGQVTFAGEGWSVQLAQHSIGSPVSPGTILPVALDWRAGGPAPRDYSVFLHLRDAAGATVAQADGQPAWFLPRPATGWPGREDEAVWDARELGIPEGLAPGTYRLIVGWYDWQTGERLDITGKAGNPAGDEAVLGDVVVDPRAGPRVDVVCLMAPESCTSLP